MFLGIRFRLLLTCSEAAVRDVSARPMYESRAAIQTSRSARSRCRVTKAAWGSKGEILWNGTTLGNTLH